MQVLVTNPTEMDATVPLRTPVGVVSEVITSPVNVQLANLGDKQPDLNRLHLPQDLLCDEQELLMDMMRYHADVFTWSEDGLVSADLVQYRIILHTNVPIAEPYRRTPPSSSSGGPGPHWRSGTTRHHWDQHIRLCGPNRRGEKEVWRFETLLRLSQVERTDSEGQVQPSQDRWMSRRRRPRRVQRLFNLGTVFLVSPDVRGWGGPA